MTYTESHPPQTFIKKVTNDIPLSLRIEKDTKKKIIKINEQWEELLEKLQTNSQSERRILKRKTSLIQTEGHFDDIKENENFRCFNYRSADKVYKKFIQEFLRLRCFKL